MKIKGILLVCILLAILTVGVVSAEGDSDFNETLTTSIDEGVSVDASCDDEMISEESGDLVASSDSDVLEIDPEDVEIGDGGDDDSEWDIITVTDNEFDITEKDDDIAWIELPIDVTEGKVLVTCGDDTLFESQVRLEEGSHWWIAGDGHYVCSFAPAYLNWTNLNSRNVVTVAFLDENDDVKDSNDYMVLRDDNRAHFVLYLTAEDFDWWVSGHEFWKNGGSK